VCAGNLGLLKIGQKYHALYMRMLVGMSVKSGSGKAVGKKMVRSEITK
jgi:hypothetical protein